MALQDLNSTNDMKMTILKILDTTCRYMHEFSKMTRIKRMLGTFNQHLPMILSDNFYGQRKPASLLDTGMGDVPYFCAADREMCPIY